MLRTSPSVGDDTLVVGALGYTPLMGVANPYAAVLDGLVIEDPVAALFDFCRAREHVRMRREAGEAPPWSDDPILQRGRFLNVFREDDRGSKAVQRFVEPVRDDLRALVHALFFARWCNRQSTLDVLLPGMLEDPAAVRAMLTGLGDSCWCNQTAYPVESVHWQGAVHDRLTTATSLLPRMLSFLVGAITDARGNVVDATDNINAELRMGNAFPVFMAVVDLAWFRPDLVDPASHVPTGIGAAPYMDRLQEHLGLAGHAEVCDRMIELQHEHWPAARRPFQPIDIEYLCCECRKYFSYTNGTKEFAGKNLFTPHGGA